MVTHKPTSRTRREDTPGQTRKDPRHDTSYWEVSTQPLHALVMLAPLIIAYEIGSWLFLTNLDDGTRQEILARGVLGDLMGVFGIAAFYAPAVLVVGILIVWHILAKFSWTIDLKVLGLMLIESAAWTLPVLVAGAIQQRLYGVALAESGGDLASLSVWAKLTLAIGAGVYEELLFRLILITAIHFLVHDLLGLAPRFSSMIAVGVAALAFALYHDLSTPAGGIDWARFLFMVIAGVLFGTMFLLRGFGIVVTTHALYDVLVLTVLE